MVAYLIYDRETLGVTGVQWSPSDEPSIEISDEDAIAFMSGTRSLLDYRVDNTEDMRKVTRIKVEIPLPVFWKLARVEDADHVQLVFHKNHFFVKMDRRLPPPVYLFATLKDDPAWLVSTWDLSRYEMDKKGRIKLTLANPDKHSFYMSKINETSDP